MKLSISALIVAAIAVLVVISTASGARQQARITVQTGGSGLAVTGRFFLPRERVILRAQSGTTSLQRSVVASPAGRFATEIDLAGDNSCAPLSVTATGKRGSTASFHRPAIPDACGIVLQP